MESRKKRYRKRDRRRSKEEAVKRKLHALSSQGNRGKSRVNKDEK